MAIRIAFKHSLSSSGVVSCGPGYHCGILRFVMCHHWQLQAQVLWLQFETERETRG